MHRQPTPDSIAEALLSGASAQLRNAATVGGNLMQRTRCAAFIWQNGYGAFSVSASMVAPLGIPVRMSLGTSPSAMRMTRLSVGVLT